MEFFAPSYLKDAKSLLEGASKMLHQKKDLLSLPQREIADGGIRMLKEALLSKDRGSVERATRELESRFSSILPARHHSAWTENVEAIVVAVALAIGFQAYFLKPFKIPTGSMQPTLYGMTGHPNAVPLPPLLSRAVDFIRLGRSHLDITASEQEEVLGLTEKTILNFFTFTDVATTGGNHSVFAPRDVVLRDFGVRPGRVYEKGESIVHGYVQAGDQVFVDRMTYQFRNPERGDVFVFKTTGIPGIENSLRGQGIEGSQFYIKRLAGISTDTLRIDPPELFQNGKLAEKAPFQRVMSCKDGYRGYSNRSDGGPPFPYLGSPKETFTIPSRAYFALGDNSYNSSDSRYWGIVPERNVIGRGFFVYWPFSTRWGFIR